MIPVAANNGTPQQPKQQCEKAAHDWFNNARTVALAQANQTFQNNWQPTIDWASFQMPGPLNGMKGDAGGFLQFDNGQLNIGGYLGGTGVKGGRSAGAGGYLRLSWSGC